MKDILDNLTEDERTRYEERKAFFAKGYDENGKAQYLDMSDPFMQKAKQKINSMALNHAEREYYEAQKKAILDYNSEVEERERKNSEIEEKAQKVAEDRLFTVRKLLQKGFDNEFILSVTTVSEQDIEKLRKEMQ